MILKRHAELWNCIFTYIKDYPWFPKRINALIVKNQKIEEFVTVQELFLIWGWNVFVPDKQLNFGKENITLDEDMQLVFDTNNLDSAKNVEKCLENYLSALMPNGLLFLLTTIDEDYIVDILKINDCQTLQKWCIVDEGITYTGFLGIITEKFTRPLRRKL